MKKRTVSNKSSAKRLYEIGPGFFFKLLIIYVKFEFFLFEFAVDGRVKFSVPQEFEVSPSHMT